jgi:hypothetical protein
MYTGRSVLALCVTTLLAAAVGGTALAQSPGAPAAPAMSVPAGPAVTVVAKEYVFEGLPSTIPVGTTLTLDNQGQEVHMMLVARMNDGVTLSWDDLLALPGNEGNQYVTFQDPLVAAPGAVAEGSILISQEGSYGVFCFIPQGTTSMDALSASPGPSAAPAGPPHFLLGMRQEFTVTAPGTAVGPIPSPVPMGSMGAGASAAPMPSADASAEP